MTNLCNDRELDIIRYIGHRLPNIPHASAVINRVLKPLYNRKRRDFIVADVLGLKMELDPRECVDGNLLFCPQLYDPKEIRFMLNKLKEDDIFIDVGSHIGFYSLIVSRSIKKGKIIAIEASPLTFKRLQKNISINNLSIMAFNYGVSDREEVLRLSVDTGTNKSAQSFLHDNLSGIEVKCFPLLHILKEACVEKIKIMKLDIEGYEYKVLRHFLENSYKGLYPRFIITEFFEKHAGRTTGDQIELLEKYGYREILRSNYNRILALDMF